MNDESLIIQCNRMFYPDEIEAIKIIDKHISELKGENNEID